MSSAVYRQIGPYVIERPIGQGGMAAVFLARDSRSNALVALKVVHLGTDEDAREVQAAEERGADLQQRFSAISRYVPKVYESGFSGDYFFIAMEYVEGEDLSQAIHRGRLPWRRAVGITIQLCEFLEEAARFERIVLHNDLKPRNIRLLNGTDQIKVLDFGAAKALSLSRKVTRNDFGSIAYLSPECLDSGDRDTRTDAWALGVLLYEMVRGRQPFRADDTRRLEQLIRSRRPPEPLGDACPRALEAVIAKLLAPYPDDRYDTPAAIRADLMRVQSGTDSLALTEGWPDRVHDEPLAVSDVEPPTKRTMTPDEAPTRRTHPGLPPPAPPVAADVPAQPPKKRRRILRKIAAVVVLLFMFALMNESCVSSRADALAATVGNLDFQGLTDLWPEYRRLADRSGMGWGVVGLEHALTSQTMVLAERVMANYRTPQPTVRENQWKAAADALRRAVAISPNDTSLRAALSVCDGHIHRINGEAQKGRGRRDDAQQAFTDAVVAFREAAALRSNWPDPFLGLARTFIYGLEDIDRGLDAIAQAEKNGHTPTDRETMQLADGFRVRGETLVKTAETIRGMAQEKDYLTRAVEDFKEALKRYESLAGFGNVGINIRFTQKRLDRAEERLKEIEKLQKPWWWPWD